MGNRSAKRLASAPLGFFFLMLGACATVGPADTGRPHQEQRDPTGSPDATNARAQQAALAAQPPRPLLPAADHHRHLMSPAAAAHAYAPPLPEIQLPPEISRLLEQRRGVWNDAAGLGALLTDDVVVLNTHDEDQPSWLRGRSAAADYLSRVFGREHRIKPIAFSRQGAVAHLEGYYFRPDVNRHFGHVLMVLRRDAGGAWRIAAETPSFPGPRLLQSHDAAAAVALLDEAGVRRAAIISNAYWFGSSAQLADGEYARVRSENDWVGTQVAPHADRLVAFCSFNPLRDYALEELRRCARSGAFRGIKLHFGNSSVNVFNPEHVERMRQVFAAANEHGLAIIAHLWTGPEYEEDGPEAARAFLTRILPAAPDVTVQIAHMAGAGRSTLSALQVYADAIRAGDRNTRRLYFDVATLTDGETTQRMQQDAELMRQIGLERILYGTDAPPSPAALRGWSNLHALPLTPAEFAIIAANVAPYF